MCLSITRSLIMHCSGSIVSIYKTLRKLILQVHTTCKILITTCKILATISPTILNLSLIHLSLSRPTHPRSGRGGDLQELFDKFLTPGDNFMLRIPYYSPEGNVGYSLEKTSFELCEIQ